MKDRTYNGYHALAADHSSEALWLRKAVERGDMKGTYIEDDQFVGVVFDTKWQADWHTRRPT